MSEREKGAQDWFRKGTEAMNHKNWDYAIECFTNCVRLMPEHLLYRQSKHGCLRKLYNDNGSGAKMAGMRLMGVKTRLKKSRMQKDWKNLELTAEEGLRTNPWDPQLWFDLGDACANLNNMNIARYALERAIEYDKDNVDFNRRMGHFLFERQEFKAARPYFERLYKLVPTDSDARSMMSRCDAESTMKSGYNDADNTRDVKVEQPAAPMNAYEADRLARRGGPKPADAPGESEESDMIHAIRKDPQNVNLYLKLAEHYKGAREFPKAAEQLSKALELSKGNAAISEQLQEVQLVMLRNDQVEAEERARKNPGKERLIEKAKALKAELQEKEIAFYAHGVENNPSDLKKKYELAKRLFDAKQYSKAIPLLQQAVANPAMKCDVLVLLGECFVRDGKLDLARRQLEKALDGLSAQDRPDAFKTAHYLLGRIYEKAGKTEQAEHHYGEIMAVDYEYKDVLKRMEDMQGATGGGIGE